MRLLYYMGHLKRDPNLENYPCEPKENGNLFVATRLDISHQQRGVCEDKQLRCETDADCHAQAGSDSPKPPKPEA